MNQREKEEYLREYSVLKAQGKPFFPYAVAKDGAMACVVMAVIIAMSLVFGDELGSKVNAASTSYDARPDWYFFFLFDVLRIIRTPSIIQLATIGIPTLCMILLFLLPFYDRGPERRPERRPIATTAGIVTICAMAYLTYGGAHAGTPDALEFATPAAVRENGPAAVKKWNEGRLAIAQSGCEACHTIGDNGNPGPGPNLTHIASRLPRGAIARTLVNPTAPMPTFKNLPAKKFEAIVYFLSSLK
ncbi:MAG TPA: c-type cytochrome [Solirubrobacteraceae bacterium]|nr:c-type cytochrome [Solirubrobacteraceae bacterium]